MRPQLLPKWAEDYSDEIDIDQDSLPAPDSLMDEKEKEKVIKVFMEALDHMQKKDPENYDRVMNSIERDVMADKIMKEGGHVTPEDWARTHPFELKCASDMYYADLANEILDRFMEIPTDSPFPRGSMRAAAMSVAAYLEDLVTGTGIWDAVRSMYADKEGRKLPFYDIDPEDYFDDDLNIEDIKLLIWQAWCRVGGAEQRFFSPISQGVTYLSNIAYDILVDRFDTAPAATRTYDKMRKVLRNCDYFEVRELGYWLSISNPLTASPYAYDDMLDRAAIDEESMTDSGRKIPFDMALYFRQAAAGWTDRMSMNGCPVNKLLAVIARKRGHNELADKLDNLKVFKHIIYKVESAAGRCVNLVDEINRNYRVVKSSFGKNIDWNGIKGGIGNFVRFGDKDYANGMVALSEEEPVFKERVWVEGVTDKVVEMIREVVREHNGRRIFYLKSMADLQTVLPPNLCPVPSEEEDNEEGVENVLLMLSDSEPPIYRRNLCGLFKDKANPFYYGDRHKGIGDTQFAYICDCYLPDDLIDYIVANKLLPKANMNAQQGKKAGLEMVQDNLGFLFRFNRVDCFAAPDE